MGYDLTRVLGQDYNLVALNRQALDITNNQAVMAIMAKEKPEFVINATAYNKVELAETEKDLAFNVNSTAVGNLAKASAKEGAIFIHVSTDYVFDGSKEFFEESDIPRPLNVYGQSKLAGEELVKATSEKYYLIRTSAVFGVKQGKQKMNFVDRMVSLARQGQSLKVVNDQVTSPTYSLDLAYKIKELIEKPGSFGIYHITNQGSCSWHEFTLKILELMNIKSAVTTIKAENSGSKAIRPKMSVLKNLALEKAGFAPMPAWQDALQRYLKEKYK